MMLAMKTAAAEYVGVSMAEVMAEDLEEEVDEVEEDTSGEVVEGEVTHMKMELTPQMSPVTLKIKNRPHSQTI